MHALDRLAACVLQSGLELPYAAIRQQVATSVDLVLHLDRRRGVRIVSELLRIRGYDAARDRYEIEQVFARHAGRDAAKTGDRPEVPNRSQAKGAHGGD